MTEVFDVVSTQKRGARIAARTEIEDVRLLRSTVEIKKLPGGSPELSYNLEPSATVDPGPDDASFVVRLSYSLKISDHGAKSSDESTEVASIDFEFGALFSLSMREGDDPPEEDELRAYALTTGQFALYPYAREYVYDVTGRLALPPLTLGVLRLPKVLGEE